MSQCLCRGNSWKLCNRRNGQKRRLFLSGHFIKILIMSMTSLWHNCDIIMTWFMTGRWRALHSQSSLAWPWASCDQWNHELLIRQTLQPREHLHVQGWWRGRQQLGAGISQRTSIGSWLPCVCVSYVTGRASLWGDIWHHRQRSRWKWQLRGVSYIPSLCILLYVDVTGFCAVPLHSWGHWIWHGVIHAGEAQRSVRHSFYTW